MPTGWSCSTRALSSAALGPSPPIRCTTVTSIASRSVRSSGGRESSLPTCSRGSTRSTRDEPGSSPLLSLGNKDRLYIGATDCSHTQSACLRANDELGRGRNLPCTNCRHAVHAGDDRVSYFDNDPGQGPLHGHETNTQCGRRGLGTRLPSLRLRQRPGGAIVA